MRRVMWIGGWARCLLETFRCQHVKNDPSSSIGTYYEDPCDLRLSFFLRRPTARRPSFSFMFVWRPPHFIRLLVISFLSNYRPAHPPIFVACLFACPPADCPSAVLLACSFGYVFVLIRNFLIIFLCWYHWIRALNSEESIADTPTRRWEGYGELVCSKCDRQFDTTATIGAEITRFARAYKI